MSTAPARHPPHRADPVRRVAGRGHLGSPEAADPARHGWPRGRCAVPGTLHHLDLIAHLPDAAEPPAEGLARTREMLEGIAGAAFPASFSDRDALLVGTGRRSPTDAERVRLGPFAARLPLLLG